MDKIIKIKKTFYLHYDMKQSVSDHVHIQKDYLVRYIINYRMYVFAFALIYQKQQEPKKENVRP